MRSPANSGQFQSFVDSPSNRATNVVRAGQGARFNAMIEADAIDAMGSASHMRDADVGFDPITRMRVAARQQVGRPSQRNLMTQELSGLRSTRSIRRMRGGLGAVDCSTFSLAAMSKEQTDAMVGLMLSVIGRTDAFTHLAAGGAQCFTQYLNTVAATKPEISADAGPTIEALKAAGVLPSTANTESLIPLVSTILVAFGLSSARAVELGKCGAAITAANGWGNYATAWAASDCMTKSWYENPWYLGAGAAVVIGAVWFATRKQKAS